MRYFNFLNKGSDRSKKAKRNIIGALFFKGASMVISFLLIPMTIGYLSSYEYGVWLTLSSLLLWIDFFDIGLGNGLRNKLSESLAVGDKYLSKVYVSTTFFYLTIIIIFFYTIFAIANYWVDWYSLLNVSPNIVDNLKGIVLIVTGMMGLNFILKTTTYIYFSKQVAMMNNFVAFAGQLFSYIVISLLIQNTTGALWKVACVYSIAPVLVLIILYPITFYFKYKELAPSVTFIKTKYLKSLLELGVKFFFLKIGGLLIFTTSNFIISNVLSPEYVTPYSISQKYFTIIIMLYTIIITPMWSASTEAYVSKDYNWLQRSANKMMVICGLFIVGTIIMTIFSDIAYDIWLHKLVKIPMSLNILFAVYVTIVNISTCYSTFLFGIGKLKMQIYSTVLSGILFIIITPFLTQKYGVNGAAAALCIANIPAMILNPIQFNIILRNRNSNNNSIWLK